MNYEDKASRSESEEEDQLLFGKFLASPPPGDEVVITGMSGQFPDSHNIYHFRDNLYNKVDMVSVDNRRWEDLYPEIPVRSGKIFDIERFDSGFFGVHYTHGNAIEPMLRLLLERSVEAVMDAAFNPSELEGTKTGVYVGNCNPECEKSWCHRDASLTGHVRCMIANKISYFFKLRGPSVVADSACSSSFYALERAYRDIRTGKVDMAIVGATNLTLNPMNSLEFARLGGALSRDGYCKVFDQAANGYVRSEGIVCLFLQKAKDARRIYSQVVHVKTSCDGYKSEGITYPSGESQIKLLKELYYECKIKPSDLSFVEAHGTGTKVGDPEELRAIEQVLCKGRSKPLLLGSVKSNIGHTEPCSGLSSIVKVVLGYENGFIAPNIHYQTPREGCKSLIDGSLKVVTEKTPFQDDKGLTGLNSFGIGGGNAHVLLRRHKNAKINQGLPADDLPRIVCVSGRLENSTDPLLNDLSNRILDKEFVKVCHQIFNKDISGHNYRSYIILSKSGELKRSASQFCSGKKQLALVFTKFEESWSKIANMLRVLPLFEAILKSIHDVLSSKGINIIDIISNGKLTNEKSNFNQIIGSAVLQIAILHILEALEINCNIFIATDGVGKFICKYLDGSLTLRETLLSVYNSALKQDNTRNDSSKMLQLSNLKKGSIILEVGNQGLDISTKRYNFLSFGQAQIGLVTFLEIFGKLYQLGHNFAIDRLYPEVEYPVSRGTPMVSPLLKWDHRNDWSCTSFQEEKDMYQTGQNVIGISLDDDQMSYLAGHVIDGRELFPASGYIHLVWETFSLMHENYLETDIDVVIENIKFLRATTLPRNGTIELTVMIQRGNGNFEVTENNSVIASGNIRAFKKDTIEQIDLHLPLEEESQDILPMTTKDVYKELRLRGYNYTGAFRRIVECDGTVNKAKVNWDSNWVTFIDNLFQLKLVQMDTRDLYVPTEIKRLSIAGRDHLAYVESLGENPNLPVYLYKDTNLIKCGGIEIRGFMAKAINRRKPKAEPVLEKYVFVPNETQLNIKDSVRVMMQLILENLSGISVKVVEEIDESIQEDSEILSSIVHDVLSDLPLIRPSITLLTNQEIKIPNVATEDKKLHLETDSTLVIGSNLCQSLMTLSQAFRAVKENGFVLSREPLDSKIQETNLEGFDVLTVHTVNTEKFYLLRKKTPLKYSSIIDITGGNEDFSWLDKLQKAMKQDANVIIVTQNEPLNGILGFVNCIRQEPGCSNVKAVFTFEGAPPFDIEDPFYSSQLKKNLAINIFKNSKWGTYRLLLLEDVAEIENEEYFGNFLVRGDLSSFKWLRSPFTEDTIPPLESRVVYVYYCALNFKDVMTASGRISTEMVVRDPTQSENLVGFEFSGKTKEGKRLMGISSGALTTLLSADRYLCWPCPDSWSLEEAATVPVVYTTVYCAFFLSCDIRKGNTILIHLGSGGVGQAAINVALYYGLTVYTTVGSQKKREFLKNKFPQLEDNRIGNSRDTSFEQMIFRETEGRGVDFVLNSLAEDKLLASVRCLASGGHFLEIGKFDMVNDNALSVKLLEKNATFHGIMVDILFKLDPRNKQFVHQLLMEGLQNGAIKPLVRTIFKTDEVEQAIRYMAAGKHIGKVLIQIRNEKNDKGTIPKHSILKGMPRYSCNPNSVQIIVGGLGGIGLELADWLILRGAKILVLTSRNGLKNGYQSYRIKIWKSYGAQIHLSTSNVTTRQGCQRLIEESRNFGPVESIFNLAVVLKDAIFENQTVESFRESLEPKAFATKYLDEISRVLCPNLREFVIFSSVSCGRGYVGQTNYGMANSIMERICERRKQSGLPALAVEWAVVGDVGLVEEHTKIEIEGTLQQRISDCIQGLDTLLVQKNAIVSSIVIAEKHDLSGGKNIVEAVAKILGLKDVKTVSPYTSLALLGLDSMTAVEINQILEREYSVFLTPSYMRNMTFARLAEIQETRETENQSEKEDKALGVLDMLVGTIIDEKTSRVPIVTLQSKVEEESQAPNILIIPGVDGVAKSMTSLAANLNGHVKCLQYINEDQPDTIQEMAKTLLPIVENNFSITEPFNIVSFSYGTLIGLELVSMLEAKGYSGNLFNIDGSPVMVDELWKTTFTAQSESLFQTSFLTGLLSLYVPKEIILKHQERISSCSTLQERLDICEEITPKNNVHTVLSIKELAKASYKKVKALIDYKITYPTIKSKVMLFKPSILSVEGLSEDYDLSKICEKPIDVGVFKGNHVTILGNVKMADIISTIANNNRKSTLGRN